MKNRLFNSLLTVVLTLLPAWASAQSEEDESCDEVEQMLEAGNSPAEVIAATVDSGMTVTEATVFAMVCGGESNRVVIATAGVGLAGSLPEARSVVVAVVATAGETSPEAAAVRQAYKAYEKTARQPEGYKTDYTPHGGGAVSPAS